MPGGPWGPLQYGIAALVLGYAVARLLRATDVLRGRTADARPPNPEDMPTTVVSRRLNAVERRIRIREILALPLVAVPLAAAILFAQKLPELSRAADLWLTQRLPGNPVGYESSLEEMRTELALGVGERQGPPVGKALPARGFPLWRPAAIAAALVPLGLLLAAWLLGRAWRLSVRIPLSAIGVAAGVVAFLAAGVTGAEASGASDRLEMARLLRSLPVSTSDEAQKASGLVKVYGMAVASPQGKPIYRRSERSNPLGKLETATEARVFSVGATDVAAGGPCAEFYLPRDASVIEAGSDVVVIGELVGRVIRGSGITPLIVAPRRHERLYYEIAEKAAPAHRAVTLAFQLAAAAACVLFAAWAISAPPRYDWVEQIMSARRGAGGATQE